MKFSVAAVLGAAAAAQAGWAGNLTYTTEVVTAYTTYCPYATTLTNNGQTITVTEATTVTFTNCPCTITKPVSTYSSVICNSCNTSVPAPPPPPPAASTTGVVVAPTTTVATLPTAGAGKAAALSGAGLAGVLGLAAFAL